MLNAMARTRIIPAALFLAAGLLGQGCVPAPPTTPPEEGRAKVPGTLKPLPEGLRLHEWPTPVAPTARRPIDEKEEERPTATEPPGESPFLAGQPAPIDRDAKEPPPEKDPPIGKNLIPLVKDRDVLFFEKGEGDVRRVHILGQVCLREGPLEVFLCKAMTKEHESILHADVDARLIHTALIAAGAKPGSPASFFNQRTQREEYKPATGTPIKLTITYYKDGKLRTDPAGYWVKDVRTKKDLASDWVFAGSQIFKDPDNPKAPEIYTANGGDVICLSNFPDSLLDLPIKSPKENADLLFEANTPRIPPLKTKVLVTLEPVIERKK
jgi:hypothetical protein